MCCCVVQNNIGFIRPNQSVPEMLIVVFGSKATQCNAECVNSRNRKGRCLFASFYLSLSRSSSNCAAWECVSTSKRTSELVVAVVVSLNSTEMLLHFLSFLSSCRRPTVCRMACWRGERQPTTYLDSSHPSGEGTFPFPLFVIVIRILYYRCLRNE